MLVLIGVDPHKATDAIAALDERGGLLARTELRTNRARLRALGKGPIPCTRRCRPWPSRRRYKVFVLQEMA